MRTELPGGTNIQGFIGGLYIRPFGPLKKGDTVPGHKHYIDHASLLYSGRARVETPNGVWEIEAPNWIHIPKDVEHKIEALEDGTVWYCIFAEAEAMNKLDAYASIPFPAKFHDARDS